MKDWSEEYKDILERSDVWVGMLVGYVDDGRQLTTILDPGMRFNKEVRKFVYDPEGEDEDEAKKKEGESERQRMDKICLPAINSVNEDLVFTRSKYCQLWILRCWKKRMVC